MSGVGGKGRQGHEKVVEHRLAHRQAQVYYLMIIIVINVRGGALSS